MKINEFGFQLFSLGTFGHKGKNIIAKIMYQLMGGPFQKCSYRGACLLNIFVWDANTKFERRIIQPDTGKLNSHKESSWNMLQIYEKLFYIHFK